MPVNKAEKKSAKGAAYNKPLMSQNLEKIIIAGISSIICLVRVRNIADLGLPIAWKKFEEII